MDYEQGVNYADVLGLYNVLMGSGVRISQDTLEKILDGSGLNQGERNLLVALNRNQEPTTKPSGAKSYPISTPGLEQYVAFPATLPPHRN